MYYYDGCFAKDKKWSFYTLNFVNRRKNQSSGGFFVNKWYTEGQKTLQQIQDDIHKGDTKWIDKITYYTQHVTGSSSFWQTKRNKVYSWISHHIENGHGPPNFFITLSYAEYHWPYIKQLIKDHFKLADLLPPDLDQSYVALVNDYTLIIQEYFQQHVKYWLETVGSSVFKIEHHWL